MLFSPPYKYHSEGAQSTLADPKIDDLIERATVAIDPERRELWEEMLRMLHQDIVADVSLFHMVGFTRDSPDFSPKVGASGS